MIDNLQKRGLVVRNEDVADRRNKIISLTSKGKELTDQVRPLFEDMFSMLYRDISEEELLIMKKVITKMNQLVE